MHLIRFRVLTLKRVETSELQRSRPERWLMFSNYPLSRGELYLKTGVVCASETTFRVYYTLGNRSRVHRYRRYSLFIPSRRYGDHWQVAYHKVLIDMWDTGLGQPSPKRSFARFPVSSARQLNQSGNTARHTSMHNSCPIYEQRSIRQSALLDRYGSPGSERRHSRLGIHHVNDKAKFRQFAAKFRRYWNQSGNPEKLDDYWKVRGIYGKLRACRKSVSHTKIERARVI